MTPPPYPMRVHTCHANDACGQPLRFQAYLEAADGAAPLGAGAEACSEHVGDMVQLLTIWARGQRLAGAQLRVFAIDRPAEGNRLAERDGPGGPDTLSLAVSTIQLTQ